MKGSKASQKACEQELKASEFQCTAEGIAQCEELNVVVGLNA